MTRRSKRYFALRRSRKYRESAFAKLIRVFEAMLIAKDAYMMLTAPRPKYPPGKHHPGGFAIIGEVGPELIRMHDGRMFMTHSRIFPRFDSSIELGTIPSPVIPEGLFDVQITNFMTPDAEMTVKKVDNE